MSKFDIKFEMKRKTKVRQPNLILMDKNAFTLVECKTGNQYLVVCPKCGGVSIHSLWDQGIAGEGVCRNCRTHIQLNVKLPTSSELKRAVNPGRQMFIR